MTTPAPSPLIVFRVETYQDNRGRSILVKYEHRAKFGDLGSPGIYIGQGLALVNTPAGPQHIPFEIPLPGPTISDAFAQFDAAQDGAFKVKLEELRMQALRQGADLSQLPTGGKPR